MLSANGWFFEGITMGYNQVDLLYQYSLKYDHHAENYQQNILQDITKTFGLRLKKRAAINLISHDFNSHWNGILKDVKWKLLTLLLTKAQKSSENADSEFQEIIKKEHPSNYVKEKELVEKWNLKLRDF